MATSIDHNLNQPMWLVGFLRKTSSRVFLVVLLGMVAIALGMMGFRQTGEFPGAGFSDYLYMAVQLFVMQSGATTQSIPWSLDVARFLAPLLTIGAILSLIGALVGQGMEAWKRKRLSGHVVICGLGLEGWTLCRDLQARGHKVVAIEIDENNARLEECRLLGIPVVIGDAVSQRILLMAHVERAESIVVVCGDDVANVEIAVCISALRQKLFEHHPALISATCHVQMADSHLKDLLVRNELVKDRHDAMTIRTFSAHDLAARAMFREAPLTHIALEGMHDRRVVHLIVVGYGQMGASVVREAIRCGQFINPYRLEITVVEKNMGQIRERFCEQYPNTSLVANVLFIEADASTPVCFEEVDRMRPDWRDPTKVITSIVVCLDNDANSLQCALELARQTDPAIPIRVRMRDDKGLSVLLDARYSSDPLASRLVLFGSVSQTCRWGGFHDQATEEMARKMHEAYRQHRREKEPDKDHSRDESMKDWEELSETLRDSNRQQVSHQAVKLRAFQCVVAEKDSVANKPLGRLSDAERENWARLEHQRWNAERILAGWRQGTPKDELRRITPYLDFYNRLPPEIQAYDLIHSDRMLEEYDHAGLAVYRIAMAAYGLLMNAKGQILMLKRAESSRDGGCWEFPGGKVREPAETWQQALVREVQEETGLHVVELDSSGPDDSQSPAWSAVNKGMIASLPDCIEKDGRPLHICCHVFQLSLRREDESATAAQAPDIRLSDAHVEWKWVARADLGNLTLRPIFEAIVRRYLA